ncbi:GRIP domain-containing protein [Astrocystis sublimbata]|nr:GRIP domain-containing protein [Astrocystis sublimbata]
MFSRFKDALNQTIAEEQARQRSATSSPAVGASSSPDPAKKPAQPESSGHPDPAVFEAATDPDLDTADGSSRTLSPQLPDSLDKTKEAAKNASSEKTSLAPSQDGDDTKITDAPAAIASETADLPPQVKSKLKRLEKLESKHNEVLRSYRIAHTQIKTFEQALQENTPVSTIKEPDALLEYIKTFSMKSDMAMQELRRISAEKDNLQKQVTSSEQESAVLRNVIATLKSAKADAPTDKVAGKDGEQANTLSDHDEVPKLRTELGARDEQITDLKSQMDTLKLELYAAQEQEAIAHKSFDEAHAKMKVLDVTLELRSKQLKERGESLQKERSLGETKAAELTKLSDHITQMKEVVAGLKGQLEDFRTTEAASNQAAPAPAVSAATAQANKKKNNKKKKKGGANTPLVVADTGSSNISEAEGPSTADPHSETLETKVATLEAQIAQTSNEYNKELADLASRMQEIDSLRKEMADKNSEHRKTLEDLQMRNEECEEMQQHVIDIGEQAAQAARKLKALEEKHESLNKEFSSQKEQIENLQREKAKLNTQAEAAAGQAEEIESLRQQKIELDKQIEAAATSGKAAGDDHELKSKAMEDKYAAKVSTLQSNLRASEKLCQDRYKEIVYVKELCSKLQTEVKKGRQDSEDLKSVREELVSGRNELRAVEKREKESKTELSRVTRLASDRESENKVLNDRLSAEKTSRAKLEDEKRTLGRDNRRLDADKADLVSRADKVSQELETAQFELASLRPKAQDLEEQVARLQKEQVSAKQDVELKTNQYKNAQNLLTSMRAEHKELETQLKEAQNQQDSLQEELAEAQKHLEARTREAETMRRRIREENDKADLRVREMKSQMEAAIEERDRLEDEQSNAGRKRAREAEELKAKVRELERESKALNAKNKSLVVSDEESRRRREELERIEEKATADTQDLRATVASLRSALDGSEQTVRETEKQKAHLRKLLDEAQTRLEKTNKDLKSAQAKLNPSTGSNGKPGTKPATSAVDPNYVKTIFLQLISLEEARMRVQMIPPLLHALGCTEEETRKGTKSLTYLLSSKK